ncbi:hypothetical protein [Prolixibacter bellariivorans]|uniref:hypothetical protein n=1 Tax=Prolixibacter bellariivorans TaxID=314319 RepID=UPI00047268FE|nr:hypothetical protein [Prolixibacter bellariivorans]
MNDHQRRLTILLFLVFLSTVSHAQIRVVDGDDHSAISFAQLIAPDGRLVGTSNTEEDRYRISQLFCEKQ